MNLSSNNRGGSLTQAVATCVASLFVAAVLRFARGKTTSRKAKPAGIAKGAKPAAPLSFSFCLWVDPVSVAAAKARTIKYAAHA